MQESNIQNNRARRLKLIYAISIFSISLFIFINFMPALFAQVGSTVPDKNPPSSMGISNLRVLGRVQPFSLIDSAGNTFKSSELEGKIWLGSFFFTSCPGICPLLNKNIEKVVKSVSNEIQVISISSDPETDKPEILRQYRMKMNFDHGNWKFLTGKKEDIIKLSVSNFKLGMSKNADSHSPRITLVDQNGNIRGYFNAIEPDKISKLISILNNENYNK